MTICSFNRAEKIEITDEVVKKIEGVPTNGAVPMTGEWL